MYLLFHLEHLPMSIVEHEVFISQNLHDTGNETRGQIHFHVNIGKHEFIASMNYTISYNVEEYAGDYWTPPFTEYTFHGLGIDYGSFEIVIGPNKKQFTDADILSLKSGIKHMVMRESKKIEEDPFSYFDIEE